MNLLDWIHNSNFFVNYGYSFDILVPMKVRSVIVGTICVFFLFACISNDTSTSDFPERSSMVNDSRSQDSSDQSSNNPSIMLINYSSYPTKDIEFWIQIAESKMASRTSNIFAFIYPVGKQIEPFAPVKSHYADGVFGKHEVLLKPEEIEFILREVEEWLRNDPCIEHHRDSKDEIDNHLSDYRTWLEQGADASTMHGVCSSARVVGMGITYNMREHEPLMEFQDFLFHEFYHAFQQDLEMEGECQDRRDDEENSNSVWLVEGGAHYFSTHLITELNNIPNPRSRILEIADRNYKREGHHIGPDKWGAAALLLMVEKDMITEESILDGTLFHNCDRELKFGRDNPNMQRIKDSWHLIEKSGEGYEFQSGVISTN